MQTEQRRAEQEEGYGLAREPAAVMSPQDERTWSVLAHLSIFLNLLTGFLGPVASLLVWFFYRDRSQKVAFQALQSTIYQGAWIVILAAGWAITGLLTFILIGFLLVPGMALISVFPFAHSAYAAYRVSRGENYRYPWVADLIEDRA